MTDQQLILLGLLFFLGFIAVSVAMSAVERNRSGNSPDDPPSSQADSNADSKTDQTGESPPHQERELPWYEILEVDESASLPLVHQAYRRQIAQYHPDKIAGMAEELRKLANLRTLEINAAYEFARKVAKKG